MGMINVNKLLKSDYYVLARFVVPLAFTDIAVDIGEQVRPSTQRLVCMHRVRLCLDK